MTTYPAKKPDWFQLDDYLVPLNERHWMCALVCRRTYRATLSLRESHPGSQFDAEATWANFRAEAGPPFADDCPHTVPQRPAAWEIPDDSGWSFQPVVHVALNLDAPDSEIVWAVRQIVEENRRSYPGPLPRRGRPAKPKPPTADRSNMHSWADYRILALFDLCFWADLFGRRFRDEDLGQWLYPDMVEEGTDVRRRAGEAREKLEEALAERMDEFLVAPRDE